MDRPSEGDIGRIPRGLLLAGLAALAGAAATVLLGGVLSVSAGLVVVAALTGRAVGLSLALGSRSALPAPRRTAAAVLIAAAGVALGQAGVWLYARSEGGVLAPLDYLGQTFGVIVPLQFAFAIGFAWWATR